MNIDDHNEIHQNLTGSSIESSNSLSDLSDRFEILFLDTFTSSSNLDVDFFNDDPDKKESNFGLVQFSCPVVIHEVRIIPLSTLVSAESLRTVRLGATIPSSFDIHFYVNDLKAKESSTFLDIGCFTYKEFENYVFKPSVSVATDGLFLRGFFESVTLAVLGEITDLSSLLNKDKDSIASKLSNDSKDFDIDDSTSNPYDNVVDIKEPDDASDFVESGPIEPNTATPSNNFVPEITVAPSSKSVQDVHSLSSSPDHSCTRIPLSPSPSVHRYTSRLSTPKSHSNSSRENRESRSKKVSQEYDYEESKKSHHYSTSSRSSSISPSNHSSSNNYSSLKSRISLPSTTSKSSSSYPSRCHPTRSSTERDVRDEQNSSSHHSHYRDRSSYDYSKYYSDYQKLRRSEKERSSEVSSSRSRPSYVSSKYDRRCSRSSSKDSDDPHSYRSLNHRHDSSNSNLSRTEKRHRRSISLEKDNDNRSIHSRDSRDDNRSICSIKTRNSGGHFDYISDNSRDLSPKAKHQRSSLYPEKSSATTTSRSRRSRSVSPSRKRRHDQHRSLNSPISREDSVVESLMDTASSPDRKKPRYTENIESPSRSPSSVNFNSNDKNDNLIADIGSSKEIESIASPVSFTNEEDPPLIVQHSFSPSTSSQLHPGNTSPHSSISNVSLEQESDCDSQIAEPNNLLTKNDQETIDNSLSKIDEDDQLDNNPKDQELFEPLSDASDDGYLPLADNDENDNFEQISTSSDEDNFDDLSDRVHSEEKAELEIISSDEEYSDDLNAALASDKVEYAKNYLDITGGKYDDDEIDSAFDFNKNIFNPLVANRLSPLEFPFNSNKTTTFIDLKLFRSILKFVDDNFSDLYTKDYTTRKNFIQEDWVECIEKLASDIMQLTCPIYYSFNDDDDGSMNSEQEIETLIPTLISIAKDGLDFELAQAQKQIPFKVRHLKAGIKLLVALFSSFDIRSKENEEKLFKRLFDEDLPYDLLKLYNKPFMTLSLRLLILNGLIVICDHPEGVKYICSKSFDWSPKSDDFGLPDPVIFAKEVFENPATCYQYILLLILAGQNSRLTSVFEELLEKIHLFELFEHISSMKLDQLCNNSLELINLYHSKLSQMITSFDRLSDRIHRPLRLLPSICQYEIKTAVHTSVPLLLLSVTDSVLKNVPNQNQFEYIHGRFNCRHASCSSSKIGLFSQKSFYRFFKHFNLFEFLIKLFNFVKECPQNATHRGHLCDRLLKLLDLISSHQQGLKFLLEDEQNVGYVNSIHSILVDFNCENDQMVQRIKNFNAKFITRLYTFKLIDNVLYNIYSYQRDILKKTDSLIVPSRNSVVIDSLLKLFMMIYFEKAIFRDTVVSIITMEHNFDAIYSFIIPITSQFKPDKTLINEKISNMDSTSFIYATKIAIACIQYLPEKNLLHFYENYGKSLLKDTENVQTFVQKSIGKLHRSDIFQSHILKYSNLINWLSPLKNDNFNSHDELIIRKFVTILKKHQDAIQEKIQKVENYIDRVFFIEPELVTAIKILVALCDPSANYYKNEEPEIQLKYKYSLVSTYCFDCTSCLLTILEAITETCERPSHQTFAYTFYDSYINLYVKNYLKAQNGNNSSQQPKSHSLQQLNNSLLHQGSLILEFIRPSVRLLNLILNFLLNSIGHRFNNPTPIPVLLKLYHLLTHFQWEPKTEVYGPVELSTKSYSKLIQQQIIDIILSVYTAVYVEHSESNESLRKSVWTKMLKHVFEFISLAPKYFKSGLEILSKILPSPLPLVTNEPLNESEAIFIINYRKLWSAHLHCVNDEIENMINSLVLSSSSTVGTLLRVVCHKMCDLYSATVLTVSKTITEFLVHTISDILEYKSNEQSGEKSIFNSKYFCNNCTKILDFILDLFASSLSFRIGILNAFYCFANSDASNKKSKVRKFFSKMFEYLNRKKFDRNFLVSTDDLKETLIDDSQEDGSNESKDFITLLEEYFNFNDTNMVSTLKTFKFSDKLTSKFVVACSESLDQYFTDRKVYILSSLDSEKLEEEADQLEEMTDQSSENEVIYSDRFSRLSLLSKMPEKWNSLARRNIQTEWNQSNMKKSNLIELSKKYLNLDSEELIKVLQNYYSPVVELPEAPEKSTEDVAKLSDMNPQPKRNTMRGRGRLYGHRGDPFRSRPPNTSRPPSMHVDDFVALEQRSDSLAGLVNKNRSNHLMPNVMSSHASSGSSLSPYVKHSDFMRKKNFTPLHHGHPHMSSPYHPNYSTPMKSNMLNNSSGNSSSHFGKQS